MKHTGETMKKQCLEEVSLDPLGYVLSARQGEMIEPFWQDLDSIQEDLAGMTGIAEEASTLTPTSMQSSESRGARRMLSCSSGRMASRSGGLYRRLLPRDDFLRNPAESATAKSETALNLTSRDTTYTRVGPIHIERNVSRGYFLLLNATMFRLCIADAL